MCVAQSKLCQKWVVKGAPKRIRMTVRRGAESDSDRKREKIAGMILDLRLAGGFAIGFAKVTFFFFGVAEDVDGGVELPFEGGRQTTQ